MSVKNPLSKRPKIIPIAAAMAITISVKLTTCLRVGQIHLPSSLRTSEKKLRKLILDPAERLPIFGGFAI